MQAGDLSETVKIYRQTRTKDAIGGDVIVWTLLSSHRAIVQPMRGSERDHAAQTVAPRNYKITVRKSAKSAAIRQDDRIVWRGYAMLVRFIADAGVRPMYLTIEAEERSQYRQGVL